MTEGALPYCKELWPRNMGVPWNMAGPCFKLHFSDVLKLFSQVAVES